MDEARAFVWQGLLGAELLRRRLAGDYQTDDWGLDLELVEALQPALVLLARLYCRREPAGGLALPAEGPLLLVANHCGPAPWDAILLQAALGAGQPSGRLLRLLFEPWLAELPFLSTLLTRTGGSPAVVDNGVRLLEQGEAVLAFPEGSQAPGGGPGRARLGRFDPGFVRMALAVGAPIVPVGLAGEGPGRAIASRLPEPLGTWAWLLDDAGGELAARAPRSGLRRWPGPRRPGARPRAWPLPPPWRLRICLGRAIPTEGHGPQATTNLVLHAQLADRVQNEIRRLVDATGPGSVRRPSAAGIDRERSG